MKEKKFFLILETIQRRLEKKGMVIKKMFFSIKLAFEILSKWFLFHILLSLFPLLVPFWSFLREKYPLSTIENGGEKIFSDYFTNIVYHGQLLILCYPIIGAALGDILQSDSKPSLPKIWLGFFSITIAGTAAYIFADISLSIVSEKKPDKDLVLFISTILFIASTLISATSLLFSNNWSIASSKE